MAALISTGVMAGLHFLALVDFLYWKYRWFDTPMHLLGGVAIGCFAVVVLRSYRPFWYLIGVASAFVAWEIFEAWAGIAVDPGVNYTWDTAHDLLNDSIGAVLVYTVARYSIWRTPEAV